MLHYLVSACFQTVEEEDSIYKKRIKKILIQQLQKRYSKKISKKGIKQKSKNDKTKIITNKKKLHAKEGNLSTQ